MTAAAISNSSSIGLRQHRKAAVNTGLRAVGLGCRVEATM
jgi:hypothetical protein